MNKPVTIAVDAMGGDRAPDINIRGSIEALKADNRLHILLVGIQSVLEERVRQFGYSDSRLKVIHAEEVISMGDHAGTAVRRKKKSSIHEGLRLVKEGKAEAFISAGNSGAVMGSALLTLGRLSGVERPAILIKLPTLDSNTIVLDVGANVDCRSSHLVQFAEMGKIYSQVVEGVKEPRIAILSNASESHKGNEVTREADASLRENNHLNYIGYVEGNDLFDGGADVIICDGFVGNIVLKTTEGLVSTVQEWFRREVKADLLGLAGMFLMKRLLNKFKNRFDYEPYGAAPLLGINGLVFISHGSSTHLAIKNGILMCIRAVEENFVSAIDESLKKIEAGVEPEQSVEGQK